MKNILIADCGSTTTSVILIALTEGEYRLVGRAEAMSTHGPPWRDVTLGVRDAIETLEEETGRHLLDDAGVPIQPPEETGGGVDAFLALISAAPPVQVSLVGLMSQLSLQTAYRAVTSTYAVVEHQLSLDGEAENRSVEKLLGTLRQATSDLILFVGGIDGGAEAPIITLAQLVALALRLKAEPRPPVVYAGNSRLRTAVAAILRPWTELKPVANIQPAPDVENLAPVREAINCFYVKRKLAQLPGIETLATWTKGRLMPAAKSFEQTMHYIGQRYQVAAMGVDVGSAATTISVKRREYLATTTCVGIGVGRHAPSLLRRVGWEDFRRWLPFEMQEAAFKNFVMNKGLFPQTVPQTAPEVWLEMALAREALRLTYAQAAQGWRRDREPATAWPGWDLIVGSGRALTRMVDFRLAALILLDGLEPAGICRLVLDVHDVARFSGGLAGLQPEAALQVVDRALQFEDAGPFLNLGMAVAPIGSAPSGSTALRLQMRYADGRQIDKRIPFGALEVIPLASDEEATLNIRPTRPFRMRPDWDGPGREINATVSGGLLGLIIDARGRPIAFAGDEPARQRQLRAWYAHLVTDIPCGEAVASEVPAYAA